jgi:hypothetical protein
MRRAIPRPDKAAEPSRPLQHLVPDDDEWLIIQKNISKDPQLPWARPSNLNINAPPKGGRALASRFASPAAREALSPAQRIAARQAQAQAKHIERRSPRGNGAGWASPRPDIQLPHLGGAASAASPLGMIPENTSAAFAGRLSSGAAMISSDTSPPSAASASPEFIPPPLSPPGSPSADDDIVLYSPAYENRALTALRPIHKIYVFVLLHTFGQYDQSTATFMKLLTQFFNSKIYEYHKELFKVQIINDSTEEKPVPDIIFSGISYGLIGGMADNYAPSLRLTERSLKFGRGTRHQPAAKLLLSYNNPQIQTEPIPAAMIQSIAERLDAFHCDMHSRDPVVLKKIFKQFLGEIIKQYSFELSKKKLFKNLTLLGPIQKDQESHAILAEFKECLETADISLEAARIHFRRCQKKFVDFQSKKRIADEEGEAILATIRPIWLNFCEVMKKILAQPVIPIASPPLVALSQVVLGPPIPPTLAILDNVQPIFIKYQDICRRLKDSLETGQDSVKDLTCYIEEFYWFLTKEVRATSIAASNLCLERLINYYAELKDSNDKALLKSQLSATPQDWGKLFSQI